MKTTGQGANVNNTDIPFIQTVHNRSEMKKPSVQAFAGDDTFYPVSKESVLLTFTLEMRREDDWEESGEGQGEESGEGAKPEEDFCLSEIEKNGDGGDLLIVSMKTTRISVLKGRGGEDGSPCQDCTVNNVIVVAESSTVTLGEWACTSSPVVM